MTDAIRVRRMTMAVLVLSFIFMGQQGSAIYTTTPDYFGGVIATCDSGASIRSAPDFYGDITHTDYKGRTGSSGPDFYVGVIHSGPIFQPAPRDSVPRAPSPLFPSPWEVQR